MMQILSNAFANSSSSLLQAKFNGLMGDFVTPPLSPFEQLVGFGAGAATRGFRSWAWSSAAIVVIVPSRAPSRSAQPWAIAYFGLGAALIMGFIGIMAGLWAEKFDHMAAVTNFVIMPMTFLSGTFYLIEPPAPSRSGTFSQIQLAFFYLIDGFRYGFIGQAEGSFPGRRSTMTGGLVLFLGAGLACGCSRPGYKDQDVDSLVVDFAPRQDENAKPSSPRRNPAGMLPF